MNKKDSNNPLTGFNYALQGLSLIRQPGLRRFVLIPLLINIIIFSAMLMFGIEQFDSLMASYLPESGVPAWLPDWQWLSWIIEPFRWLLWLLFAVAFMLIFFYGFTLFANLIGAPFNELLAAKVEQHLTGSRPTEAAGTLMTAVGPAIRSELQKLGYFVTRGIPLLILFVIPGVNLVAPLVWGLFSAWAIANEYAEYPMGGNGILFKQQRIFLKKRRLSAFGFGGGVMLMMMIPIINFAAMPAAVCGATAWWVERLKSRYPAEL